MADVVAAADGDLQQRDQQQRQQQQQLLNKAKQASQQQRAAADAAPLVAPRPPTAKPEFTVGTLRRAIPAHCFERSLLRSSAYLLADLLGLALLYAATTRFHLAPEWVQWLALWPAYWFAAGAVATGVWVIAHECGHGAFSAHGWVNDAVGFVFHSLLLVPYFSWKHSHRRHHSNTGSVAKDEVFVPSRDEHDASISLLRFLPYRVGFLLVQCLLGWPMYLFFNASGREYSARCVSHFDPYSPIFSKRERPGIVASDVGVAAVLYALYAAGAAWGWGWLARVYVVPYLIVNFWLVTITFLQHTHPNLPHYDDDEWDWLRGALATVDRSYGRVLDALFHHIADTHVAHHLFSQMPHYHAEEATEALKPILGAYYSRDGRNVMQALWQELSLCHYVAEEEPPQQQQQGKGEAAGGGEGGGALAAAARRGVVWFQTHVRDGTVSATAAAAAGFNAEKAAKLA